jgi:teichuronic acid exporter
MTSFQRKITKGVLWSAVDVLLRQGVQFVILIFMARILAPEDFGVAALLALFVGLANVFIDGGFSSALIQRQNTTHIDESTVFFFNLGMGLLTSLTLVVSAPFISKLFEKPVLHYLIYAMALNVFIGAFGSIHTTLLTKELNLKLIAKVGGIASTLSGMLAIILAVKGFGVWSLAIQIVSASLISTLLLWLWHSWRPSWTFSINALGSYFRFGSYLMIAAIIDILHTNLYSVLIGKFYHIRDVGYYDRAQKTQLLPVNFIMLIINRVAFSTFSSVAEDKERIARVFRKAQQVVMFVNIPFAVVMIVMAEPIVLTLFGKQWLHSAPILEVLGIVGLIWPMHVLNINLLQAQGRSDLFFKIMLIKKTVAISLTIAGSFHSIMALAWAQVAASVFSLIVNAYYSKVLLNYGLLRQLRDLTPSLMAAIPMGGVMWIVKSSAHESFYTELAIGLLSGGTVYLLLAYLFRMSPLREIAGLLLKSKKSTLTVEGM